MAEATVDDPSKPKAAPDVTQNFYLESNVAGMLCVRSRRDPSWSCDIGLFLRDPYDSYPQIAKTTIQAALQDAVKVLR